MTISGGSPEKQQNSVDKWIAESDNIKQNLLGLKEEIKTTNKEKSIAEFKIDAKNFDTEFDEALKNFDQTMEKAAENDFDTYAHNHTTELQDIINDNDAISRKGKLDTLANNFQTELFSHTDAYVKTLKNLATSGFKIEINDLRSEVTGTKKEEGNGKNPDGEQSEKGEEGTGEEQREPETYINPQDLNSTEIESYTYYDFTKTEFDKNGDGRMSNRELRDAGIVNRYRNNNIDKNTAILGILNKNMEDAFEKSYIRGINRDDLTEILDEMLDPLTYANEHNTEHTSPSLLDLVRKYCDVPDENGNYVRTEEGIKLFKKEFKDVFKENFINTKKYKSKGIFRDTDKIANLIITAIEGENDPDFWDALERLADVGDAAKNMDYTAAYNDDVMLKNLKLEDEQGNNASYRVFMFLCDFDSDGIVNSTDITGRDKQNKKRRDTGSVMGGQLYANFLQYATTERRNIDDDDKEEKVIVDGQETSDLIKNILTACGTSSENAHLQQAIQKFIKEQTENGNKQITMMEFMEFMTNTTYVHAGTNKETSLSSAADIKEYLKTVGEQLNEGKDLSRLFIDKKNIQNNILANVDLFDASFISLQEEILNEDLDLTTTNSDFNAENPFNTTGETTTLSTETQEHINDNVNTFMTNANNLQQTFNQDALEGVRNTCTYNTMKAINYVTDLIYLRLGKYPGKAIADMFSGTTFGLGYSFYNPDKTINEKEAKKALRDFIEKRTIISVGAGVSENGHPIIGASVHWESLSEDLGNKTIAHISGGLDIVNLLKGMFPLTFDIGIGKARQINKKNVKRLTTKQPIPVNRIGVETGMNFNSIRDGGLYLGLSVERDFPTGIEQKARYYDVLMKGILFSYPKNSHIDICTSRNRFNEIMRNRITSSKNQDVLDNEAFLLDMVDKIGDEMEMTGVFELIKNNENDPELQKKILLYIYMTFIDAFHENAIEQKSYEQLTGQVKLTKFGLKASLANILMRTGVGAGLGSVIPGRGTVLGAATGVVTGMFTFSTRKTSYTEDAFGKGKKNYTMIERGIGAQDHEDLVKAENKTAIAEFLEKELNPNEKLLEVKISTDDKIEITAVDGNNPTLYMNAYFSDDALTNNDFSFDGKKIVIGNTSLRVSRDIKRDKVETFLMIGQETVYDNMTKLSSSTGNKNTDVPTLGNLETAHYKNMSYEEIKNFVESDNKLIPYKTKILGFFDTDGSFKKGLTTIPTKLQGSRISIGTLTFQEDPDGNISITGYDNSTPVDKMKIDYITQTKVDVTNVVDIHEEKYQEAVEINTNNIFSTDTKLDIFKNATLETTISKFENRWATLYTGFMTELSGDENGNRFIDEEDYEKAFGILKKIFNNNTAYKNVSMGDGSILGNLKQLIQDIDIVNENIYDKAFVVDRCKALFSYDIGRGPYIWTRVGYQELKGPDRQTAYPLNYDYKKDLQAEFGNIKEGVRTPVNNLVGFTSFYRINHKTEATGFSMTALGGTNVLSNGNLQQSMRKIEKGDIQATENWFVNNLNASKTNKDIILAKLNAQLANYNITLNDTHLEYLFSGKYETIDIGGKIVKLDLTYYFYLLGECANESIGAMINGITIYEKTDGEVTETTISGEILGKKSKIKIQTHTVNAEYDISATQNDLTLSGAVSGLFKKHPGEGSAGESTEASNTNDSVTGGDGTDEGNALFGGGD